MSITANRNGLKDLADLTIDAQFCQQYGTQLFSYQGDNNSQYQQLCATLAKMLDDILDDIAAIKTQLPG